jgi:hypothetical protein
MRGVRPSAAFRVARRVGRSRHQLTWVEASAGTLVLAVGGLIASGWVDPMLPWTQ